MRTLLAFVARSLAGLLVLGVVGAVVLAATTYPSPEPAPVTRGAVPVPAPPTVLVCPGPVRLPTELEPGEDAAYDPQFDTAPSESVTQVDAVTARTREGGLGGDAVLTPLGTDDPAGQVVAAGDAAATRVRRPAGPLVLRADPVDGVPAWVAATLHVRTGDGDVRGLVTAPCQQPGAQAWLVGGSTELGSSARLVLQNPGLTPASVTVRLWGANGPVEPAGVPEYLVPPRSERVVLLEGLAAEQGRLVVQTSAVGGMVTAYLQDSRLDGLVPRGVDDVVAGSRPATRQVVPAIAVSATDDPEAALVRILAPGEQGGAVSVSLLGPQGHVPLPGGSTDLRAGTVLDIPLSGLPAGDYTAIVNADVPVVVGAMVTRTGVDPTAPSDRAWVPAASGGSGPLALPDGVEGRLVLAVAPDGELRGRSTVVVETVGGRRVERTIDEGGTVSIPLADLVGVGEAAGGGATSTDALQGVVVRTTDPRVVWGVVLEDDAMVSVLVPVPLQRPQAGVTVDVR